MVSLQVLLILILLHITCTLEVDWIKEGTESFKFSNLFVGIVKTHNLAFIECETLQAVFSKDMCVNQLTAPSRWVAKLKVMIIDCSIISKFKDTFINCSIY